MSWLYSRAIHQTNLVPEAKLLLVQAHTSTKALCYAEPVVGQLAREFKTDAAEARVVGSVNTDAGGEFVDDCAEVTGFQATGGSQSAGRFINKIYQ